MSTSRPPYDVLSRIYDKWVGRADHERMLAFVAPWIAPSGGEPLRVLDVCCGTGTIAIELARRGHRVVGIDGSEPMLAVARDKVASAGLEGRIELGVCDVRGDRWPGGTFDLALSTFDSVNYFSPAELGGLLSRMYARLAPGGTLVLDVNTERKIRTLFGNSVYAETFDDYCYIWKNHLETDRIRYDITIFLRDGEGPSYQRREESHVQYVHRHDAMKAALESAGFVGVAAHDDYGDRPLTDESMRATYIAHRSRSTSTSTDDSRRGGA